ncbi:coiled-coil domain-containing protein 174-like [Amphibalanus amphitrite]|uniref:coiled-coil domain-containing protein 174-like n=1 Tax=Amphibalanus amphitrite TaxID=1232801 RepID=UPI001C90C6B0|nr:coiled-coil domain-containing protein 174-like [Amphibalanus amphitrite]XP_043238780.1 coiled-coil domain-containing protein 174-like [Amphibalanus amphitrite]XP_043238781.1 coiled-coil domain-containing protein 174-like [Amphibalanus amphitrite]XP_043238782.1 coiled-coil domain-containing protein 174-like [Amphibalanus amphitrite]
MDKEKKIEIGTSSLVDLKAELHRKQQESRNLHRGSDRPTAVGTSGKSKIWSKTSTARASGKTAAWSKSNAGVERRDQRDREETEQETKDLDRSRTVLEAKAMIYDRLQTGTEALEDDSTNEQFLVNFQQKAIDDVTRRRQRRQAAAEGSSAEPPPPAASADEEWVEFTDSLGRSRTVMRRDLDEYRRRDQESRRTGDESQQPTPELMSEDQRRDQQRQIWEQQELENAAKRDIHYQDVLFNEARAHGAGYFAFSQDADERARQRAELDELRGQTESQQTRAELARKRKNKQLKERLRKVRERKRLRLGLPIEDRLEKADDSEEDAAESGSAPTPAAAAALTPEQIAERLQEERREYERKAFVRDWDRGKQGVAKHSVLTQEEWVERQRKDRPAEFAPPTQYEPRGSARRGGGPRRPETRPAQESSANERPVGGSGPQPTWAATQGVVAAGQSQDGGLISQADGSTANTGQTLFNVSQPPPNMNQPRPNLGQFTPGAGQPPPSVNHPPLNMAQHPPNMAQPPLVVNHPPPHMAQPPPNVGQPPPNMAQPPPSMAQPPSRTAHPPNITHLPPNTAYPPINPSHPPPDHDPQPAVCSSAAGWPARAPSYRARQAAAADLTDPDCVPPGENESAGRGGGTEVAPPATAEYFGGTRRGRRQPAPARPDVGSALEAGLALLSQDTEQKDSKTFDL